MDIRSTHAAVQQAIAAYEPGGTNDQEKQVLLLKKALDAQKSQSQDLLSLLDGKGRIVDLRA